MKIRVIIAIIILALFSLKMGAGLFLHNIYHDNPETNTQNTTRFTGLNASCKCLDDFLMPFTGTADQKVSVVTDFRPVFLLQTVSPVSTPDLIYFSLRAPPTFLS